MPVRRSPPRPAPPDLDDGPLHARAKVPQAEPASLHACAPMQSLCHARAAGAASPAGSGDPRAAAPRVEAAAAPAHRVARLPGDPCAAATRVEGRRAEAGGPARAPASRARIRAASGGTRAQAVPWRNSARWDAVDLGAKTITFAAAVTKTRTTRVVSLSVPAVALLRELEARRTDDWLFPGRRGPISLVYAQALVAAGIEAAGFTDATPHDLRRTCATGLGELGAPVSRGTQISPFVGMENSPPPRVRWRYVVASAGRISPALSFALRR